MSYMNCGKCGMTRPLRAGLCYACTGIHNLDLEVGTPPNDVAVTVRLPPYLSYKMTTEADRRGVSLNKLMLEVLEEALKDA